ncbi:UPF0728 protein-like [Mercenaria mercenaria]|uniref:UPF0728 protein-like n=1 Tax=Mercenaria mercenaria TaxID=6596 RepID=UPI00234ED0B1|nr:UPF0728 protein-like [Mercenaria mercenaria]XP_053392919.1 UPF0728 protein-like [Mercenaria mercenaria]
MPNNAKVFIHYGPYEAAGIVDHRESRLKGLQAILKKDGHTVELVKAEDWNSVELNVNGEQVFKCDINDLDYGSDGELDSLCIKARDAVKKAY